MHYRIYINEDCEPLKNLFADSAVALFLVEVVMSGSGLNNTKDPAAAICRFTQNDRPMDEFTTRATPMSYHRLTCPLPPFNDTSNFEG